MITIGITGTLGAGKGEIVSYLKTKGFIHYSAREFLIKEVTKRGLSINRDNTTLVANDLRATYNPSYIIESLYREAEKKGKNAVIESVRALGELDFLRKQKSFYLFAIDADPKIRYERIQGRKSELDKVSYEKFLSDEEREMRQGDPTKGNIAGCMERADFWIINDGSIEELQKKVDLILLKILPK
jgi:dephospho-CoA kinase